MGATQRFKQTQQQARVITNENGYLKGMYYTDVPLPEGYVKTLVNLDIDSLSGKLTPRAGLQTTQILTRDLNRPDIGHVVLGHNPLIKGQYAAYRYAYCKIQHAKYCGGVADPIIQYAVYHNHADSVGKGSFVVVAPAQPTTNDKYYSLYLGPLSDSVGHADKRVIHGQECAYTELFIDLPGAFLNDQYYQFTRVNKRLMYTKLGKNITDSDVVSSEQVYTAQTRKPDQYYACIVEPTKISPSTAVAQGYNMLLDDPYTFECVETPVNVINILGVIPYDKSTGTVVLNPQKNDMLTLKAYYTAPQKYISTEFQAKYYATSYQKIEYTDSDGQIEEADPKFVTDLENWVTEKGADSFSIGTWWHVADTTQYFMIMYKYNTETQELYKNLEFFGFKKPNYSEKLNVIGVPGEESSVKVIWETRQSTSSDWTELTSENIKLSEQNLKPFVCDCNVSDRDIMVRLRVIDITPEGVDEDIVLATQTIGISVSDNSGVKSQKYDLSKCTGMCEWEQRLVLWGVPEAPTTLFVSDTNNPSYFPYPNNTDTFSDPIMGVYNYGDELLVLTTNALYRLTWSTEGTGWTHTLVQRNLHITDSDTHMNCVIKNMFLFKSDNYYYMMVPKSSSGVKGETTIAPISKQIEGLLDNFHEEVYKLVKLLCNSSTLVDFTKNLCYYYPYIDGTNVVLNYVYDLDFDSSASLSMHHNPKTSQYLYVQLIYDTDLRTWRLRIFSTPYILQVPFADSMQQTRFVLPLSIVDTQDYVIDAELMYCSWVGNGDQMLQYKQAEAYYVHAPILKNYQYIDTGNREIDTEHKKRFREFQFKIKNIDATEVAFHTGFYVDGSERKNITKYDVSVNTDNEIIVQPVLNDPVTYSADGIFMPTELGTEDSKVCWVVGTSAFPGRTLWKVRMPVSGKGYTPRAELISRNEQKYELLGHSWVYRTMNGR